MEEKIFLVIPCYNEAQRLDFKQFDSASSNCYFLFVNDGSTDNTLEVLKNNLKENMYVLDLKKNCGKAEAVRRGILHLKELPGFAQTNWVGFWDADMAAPLSEVNNFLLYEQFFYPDAAAIFGSRVLRLGGSIDRSSRRHFFGRVFTTLVSLAFKFNSYDTQCGAKIFRKELIDKYFSEPFISSWLMDIELLLRMKREKIVEYPLREWQDIPGSKLKVSKVVFEIICGIIRLKRKYG